MMRAFPAFPAAIVRQISEKHLSSGVDFGETEPLNLWDIISVRETRGTVIVFAQDGFSESLIYRCASYVVSGICV